MIQLGKIEIKNPYIMAPLAGITDSSFRIIAEEFGAGFKFTEMISAKAIFYKDKKTHKLLEIDKREGLVGVQLFGREEDVIRQVIREVLNNREDISVIDLNFGCPAPKIVKNREGSYLLNEVEQIGRIVEAATKISKKPIGVKIRSGYTKNDLNFKKVGKVAQEAGASYVTLHARTSDMYYTGKANREHIYELKQYLKIPVIGSGDIFSPDDAFTTMERTKCDGVLIARGALGNPFIFKDLLDIKKGNLIREKNIDEVMEVLFRHYELMLEKKPERTVVAEMRKHAAWYLKGFKGANTVRNQLNTVKSVDKVYLILNEYRNLFNK